MKTENLRSSVFNEIYGDTIHYTIRCFEALKWEVFVRRINGNADQTMRCR